MKMYSKSYGTEDVMNDLLGSSVRGSAVDFMGAIAVLALVLAIISTILAFALVLSKKGRDSQNPFMKFLVSVCDFRSLIIEKILKALYIFSTAYVIFVGFLGIFNFGSYNYGANLVSSVLTMILGPIVVRIIYELIMLGVLAVKNIIQINNKLSKLTGDKTSADVSFDTDLSDLKKYAAAPKAPVAPAAPVAPVAPAVPTEPHTVYCEKCGTPYDENAGGCPNCNK